MNKKVIALIAAVILLPSLYAAISPMFYKTDIKWHSYQEARAMNVDKPIFVFAKMRFCATCAAMEKEVFTDANLAKRLNEEFIPVTETINFAFSSFAFDDLKDSDGEQLSFRGFPAVMVVKGSKYSLSHGYKNIEVMHALLDEALGY